ncbi:fatty-acid amide hydrolase 1 [Latimeria chalumnae]|uniref:fatty-acid amide hydrolase 1 n=1 Tax=Latimeria chalumnae TaxID=7897 RepID=UPI00313BF1C0
MLPEQLRQLLPEWIQDWRVTSAVLCGSLAAFQVVRWRTERRAIQKKIDKARQERDRGLKEMREKVLQFKHQNPDVDARSILSLSLRNLSQKLREGALSPEAVLYTYMEKALEVTRETNCVTEFFQECEVQLEELKQKTTKGLLYGVPISIKDSIAYKGHDSTAGLVQWLDQPAAEDSVIIQVFKKLGAIPFVKTNVPQSMMNYDCSNPTYGQTVNLLNPKKTPGGSSGGEGALIGGGGSVLGIGTDIGGSIRIPSSFCGICGLKPTGNRISVVGLATCTPGLKSLTFTAGPMAKDVDSLAFCMKALLCQDMFDLDPRVSPIPFKDEVYTSSKPLRIGYYECDGHLMATPSMRRAVLEMKKILEDAGHTLVHFPPPRMGYCLFELILKGVSADGGLTLLRNFKGDFMDPSLKTQLFPYMIPRALRSILSFILKPVSRRVADGFRVTNGMKSVGELWEHHHEVEIYCKNFISEWKKLNLDVLLCPCLTPAFTIGYPGKLIAAASYTALYNLLDFPAGIVPVTTVTQRDEEELKGHRGYFNDMLDSTLREAVEGGVGLPVSVQCVALPWQDELCLRFMREVEVLATQKPAA